MVFNKETDRSLRKDEILRGYDAFKNVLIRSKIIEAGYLKCYLQLDTNTTSPQSRKVGFIVSKRKVRKAFVRNRIKRLLKESYRNEKYLLMPKENIKLIFTVSDSGANSINLLYKSGFKLFSDNMKTVFSRINLICSPR